MYKRQAQAFAEAGGAGAPVTEKEKGYDRTVWRPRNASGPGAGAVQLLVVHGGGHTWPGSSFVPDKRLGPTSDALDATDTILDFFAAG